MHISSPPHMVAHLNAALLFSLFFLDVCALLLFFSFFLIIPFLFLVALNRVVPTSSSILPDANV